MKKKVFGIVLSLMMAVGVAVPTYAASCGSTKFFGLDPWYATLECDGTGAVVWQSTNDQDGGEAWKKAVIGVAGTVLKDLLMLAGIAAVVMVIVSGIKFMLSGGDPAGAAKAKKSLTAAIVGLVIVLLAQAIVYTVVNLL